MQGNGFNMCGKLKSAFDKASISLCMFFCKADTYLMASFPAQPALAGTICKSFVLWTSFQTDNHTRTSWLNFYRPDALPDA